MKSIVKQFLLYRYHRPRRLFSTNIVTDVTTTNNLTKTLANKVALVTGSTSGIGLGIAEALAENGCSICLNGFGENIDEIVTSMEKKYNVPVMYNGANMLNRNEIKDMIENDIKSTFGTSVDILVNNCGMQHVSPIESFDEDIFEKVIQLNLTSNFYTTKYVLNDMREKEYGRIINIASTHGKVASVNKSAYVASKHGVVGLTKTIALETAKDTNITCNAICPGFVLTPLVAAQIDVIADNKNITFEEAGKDLLSEKVPSENFVTVEQLGGLCSFLCSDNAEQLTGQDIAVDGGWTSV